MDAGRIWKGLEYTCRVLGISTASVLLGVGIDTGVRGQFTKLAVYLLTGCGKAENKPCRLWRKTVRPNGLQKFVLFIFLSVACFLHPVLIWHATIPGAMLVVSGLAYFALNLRKRFQEELPDCEASRQRRSGVYVTGIVSSSSGRKEEQMYSFHCDVKEKKTVLVAYLRNILKLSNPHCSAVSEGPKAHVDDSSDSEKPTVKMKHMQLEESVIRLYRQRLRVQKWNRRKRLTKHPLYSSEVSRSTLEPRHKTLPLPFNLHMQLLIVSMYNIFAGTQIVLPLKRRDV
ncbi:ras association domain-containing protein 4a isoform X3 [Callorhinchus milii]|uniref:ras association domain-containing protein 4a isoform X3 n=1 Tax=Callorhinchus milii TaxID=7868 RepID=UPI001C3F6C86|nr:ras association domain-containing protein 4a isoform X3 [Callorhinchus milii]